MDMTLYRAVGAHNRVALGKLATAEFYAAQVDEKGVITLMPVNIVAATTKPQTDTIANEPIVTPDGTDPWSDEQQ